jgi:glycosyltransferase involved in cell wall biosynthesis
MFTTPPHSHTQRANYACDIQGDTSLTSHSQKISEGDQSVASASNAPSIRISIISPVYNVEKYIRESIESVIAQTFPNWELILIDDGSSDNSGKICDEYASQDTRITVIHKENGGVASARNLGMTHAKGEYVIFLDSDDLFKPNALRDLYDIAVRNTDCQIIQGAHEVIKYSSLVNGQSVAVGDITISQIDNYRIIKKGVVFNSNDYYSEVLCGHMFSQNVLIRRNFLLANKIRYNESQCYMEDAAFWINLLSFKPKCIYGGIPTYIYRWNIPTSLSGSPISDKKIRSQISVAQSIKSKLNSFSGKALEIAKTYSENLAIAALVSTAAHGVDTKGLLKYLTNLFPKISSNSSIRNKFLSRLYNCSPKLTLYILIYISRILKK